MKEKNQTYSIELIKSCSIDQEVIRAMNTMPINSTSQLSDTVMRSMSKAVGAYKRRQLDAKLSIEVNAK